jgi:hypothetical protein
MGAISASVTDISRSLSKINDESFRTNEKLVNRLLQDADFQVNDNLFRKYINLLFDGRTRLTKTWRQYSNQG